MYEQQTQQTQQTYKELLAQRAELEQKIQAARKEAVADAISKVRQIVNDFELTEQDVFGRFGRSPSDLKPRAIVAPKYRDPQTGQTWTGRGKPPLWIADKNRDDFLIEKQEELAAD